MPRRSKKSPSHRSALTERIATRPLLNREGEKVGALHFYRPVLVGADEWSCAFRIRMRDEGVVSGAGHGGDAVHALVQALEGARQKLEGMKQDLRWMGGEPGSHGVPMVVPFYFGSAFEKKVQNIVNAEVESFARSLGSKRR
jgi:hypothetical protein